MTMYIAFLRVINVSGHASIRMSSLKRMFLSTGCNNVRRNCAESAKQASPGLRCNATLGAVIFRYCSSLRGNNRKAI
jgi:hypothetical protein